MYEKTLDLKKLHGLGTDNASVMTGSVGGVAKILKEDCPNLKLIRCINHSLQLAISDATRQTLPPHFEFIMEQTYAWFARSSERQQAYTEIYIILLLVVMMIPSKFYDHARHGGYLLNERYREY